MPPKDSTSTTSIAVTAGDITSHCLRISFQSLPKISIFISLSKEKLIGVCSAHAIFTRYPILNASNVKGLAPLSPLLYPYTPQASPIGSYSVGACVNKKLTLSPLCVLRIASANVGLISITLSRSQISIFPCSGTVFVTTTLLSLLLFRVSIALPLKIPCVTIATTSRALCAMTVSAAFTSVPQVSAMSSTRIAILFSTSPTSTMRDTSFGRARSLWIRAKPRSRRSAMDVALRSQDQPPFFNRMNPNPPKS